jgi:riboflavin biosynthesis pyrimidine reductase
MVRLQHKKEILEVMPNKSVMPLKNLYLNQRLHNVSENLGRSIIYTNYICDLNEVIAVKDQDGFFRVPKALRNHDDWRLFQELEAQADVIITSKSYLGRFEAEGDNAQNVLTEFEAGGEFEDLGEWRLQNEFKSRSPDLAVVGRKLDLMVPKSAMQGRDTLFFSTYDTANSDDAKRLRDMGATVVGAGDKGVEGKVMIEYLATRRNYRTIYTVAGPSIINILLDARVLDRLYITQVNRKLLVYDPSSVKRILSNGEKVDGIPGFVLTGKYLQEKVITEDQTITAQEYLLYENLDKRLVTK